MGRAGSSFIPVVGRNSSSSDNSSLVFSPVALRALAKGFHALAVSGASSFILVVAVTIVVVIIPRSCLVGLDFGHLWKGFTRFGCEQSKFIHSGLKQ